MIHQLVLIEHCSPASIDSPIQGGREATNTAQAPLSAAQAAICPLAVCASATDPPGSAGETTSTAGTIAGKASLCRRSTGLGAQSRSGRTASASFATRRGSSSPTWCLRTSIPIQQETVLNQVPQPGADTIQAHPADIEVAFGNSFIPVHPFRRKMCYA
jgi:hypothetical protein